MPRQPTTTRPAGNRRPETGAETSTVAIVAAGDETPIFVRVAHRILASIEDGTFAVGERLASEQVLAERYGVSRPTLREAMSALQFAGYLVSKQGFGTLVVKKPGVRPKSSQPTPIAGDPVDILNARLAIEPQVIASATMHPDVRHLKEARAILDGMWLAIGSASSLDVKSDLSLHVATMSICRSRALRSIAINLLKQTNPDRWSNVRAELWTDRDLLETWATEHEATLAAIEARNVHRAMRCCRRHLLTTVKSLAQRPSITARDRKRLRELAEQYAGDPRGGAA